MMGTIYSSKKFSAFVFNESDEVAEEKSNWKLTKSGKNKSRFGDSPVKKYKFLELFAGGMALKGKKFRNEPIIVHEVDEDVKERIFRSDAALQSSSSNYNSKTFSGPRSPVLCTSYRGGSFNTPGSLKAATDRKDSDNTFCLRSTDNEPVSIISDEDNDNSSTMSSNDLVDAEGPSGEQILEHEITSHEMESNVVVYPKYVTYGRNCYRKAQLTFFCSSIKLDVSKEEGLMGSLTFEWKTVDLINIESQWLDPFKTANVCLHIKSEHLKVAASGQKSGILEVKFTVYDPYWTHTQELIKSLDSQYKEKWDVDLDSYESFEDITYLEGDCDSISISKRDFQLLQPEKFINDTIVDFYIEYLKKKMKPADQRFHFFNSFFFRKLADFDENRLQPFDAKAAFRRVHKWTKKVNLFQKDYIFIPVNFSLHWSLIVICHPGEVVNFRDEELVNSLKVPCILHMDSIKGSHRGLENGIRRYLWEEWKERSSDAAEDISTKFMNLMFLRLEVPQQRNSYDCGLFMLHYMELFVKQAPINFNPLGNFISKDWFYPTEASLKRAHIKRLIFELAKTNSQKGQSSDCNDMCNSEFKDVNEEEADVQFLHETYNSKETCLARNSDACANRTRDVTPIMAKPLISEPDLRSEHPHVNAEHMDINLLDGNTNGASSLTSSLQESPSHCEGFPETRDNGGSLIAGNDQSHGHMVLYDPSNIVLSPIKEIDETEDILDKQLAVTEPSLTTAKTNKIDSSMTSIDKSLNLLQLKENYPSERLSGCSSSSRDDVLETLVVEDSDECSSDDVFETCVVEDSDPDDSDELGVDVCENSPGHRRIFVSSDQKASYSTRKDLAGSCSNVQASKRRWPVVSEARKRLRRSSSGDLQVIFPCE